mmetsp:Transcript_1049/g.3194  ORF Transcript_1049/g.3194 Transcript_1049/m.3194 type:complete len:351 (-) Transcript_1049:5294-6346(-)
MLPSSPASSAGAPTPATASHLAANSWQRWVSDGLNFSMVATTGSSACISPLVYSCSKVFLRYVMSTGRSASLVRAADLSTSLNASLREASCSTRRASSRCTSCNSPSTSSTRRAAAAICASRCACCWMRRRSCPSGRPPPRVLPGPTAGGPLSSRPCRPWKPSLLAELAARLPRPCPPAAAAAASAAEGCQSSGSASPMTLHMPLPARELPRRGRAGDAEFASTNCPSSSESWKDRVRAAAPSARRGVDAPWGTPPPAASSSRARTSASSSLSCALSASRRDTSASLASASFSAASDAAAASAAAASAAAACWAAALALPDCPPWSAARSPWSASTCAASCALRCSACRR